MKKLLVLVLLLLLVSCDKERTETTKKQRYVYGYPLGTEDVAKDVCALQNGVRYYGSGRYFNTMEKDNILYVQINVTCKNGTHAAAWLAVPED